MGHYTVFLNVNTSFTLFYVTGILNSRTADITKGNFLFITALLNFSQGGIVPQPG